MSRRATTAARVLSFALLLTCPGRAEQCRELELPDRASVLGQACPRVEPAALLAAQAAVHEALDLLDDFLPSGDPNTRAWKTYLQWSELDNQLSLGTSADLGALHQAYAQLTANEMGLERPEFQQVALSLRRYIDLLTLATMPDLQQRHQRQMEQLADSLEAYAIHQTPQRAQAIGHGLAWLEAGGRSAELVGAIRRRLSQPNLSLDVSGRLIASALAAPIDYHEPVQDNILGVRITGTAQTRAAVDVQLVPNPRRATAIIVARGKMQADTVGRQGGVTITGDAITTFVAHKIVQVDPHGFSSQPAGCQARSRGRPHCISGGPLLRVLASIKLHCQQAAANRIAARHAEVKIARRMDQTTSRLIQRAHDAYLQRLRNPLLRRGQFPARLEVATTANSLRIVGLQAGRGQLGAPGPPPESRAARDLTVRVHQSALNNVASALLAGRTLTDEDSRSEFPGFLQPAIARLNLAGSEQPLSVIFAGQQPISVSFAEQRLVITIRGQRWILGQRRFGAMNVSASYRVQSAPQVSQLVREAELQIVPPALASGRRRLTISEVALRRLLARKFNRVFQPVIHLEETTLPGVWRRAVRLRVDEVHSVAGWLQLTCTAVGQLESLGAEGR